MITKADARPAEDLYRAYLVAFMNSIQGRPALDVGRSITEMASVDTANLWAIAAGLRDGVAFREGRVGEDESFNTYEDFVSNLKAAVRGIPDA